MSAAEGRPVRVAVIGAGQMANLVHYPSLVSLPGVEIVGICDLSPERLRETGERWHVSALFGDWSAMLDEVAPDAVYVIGPPELMFGIWCACLRRGLDLFVEKPLGLTLHQARTLARLAEENGCVTQVGFQRRSSPLLESMLARVRERGEVVHAVCRFYKNDPTPMVSARDRMMDDGVHVIDTLRHLCGGELVAVSDVTRRVLVDDLNFVAATWIVRTARPRRLPRQERGVHRRRALPSAALVALRRRTEDDDHRRAHPRARRASRTAGTKRFVFSVRALTHN